MEKMQGSSLSNDQSEWKEYLNDRLILKRDGYFVIKPRETIDVIPLACEVCETLYSTKDDELAYQEFGCCDKCAMKWAHPDRDRWKAGHRPSQDEIKEALINRPMMSVTIL